MQQFACVLGSPFPGWLKQGPSPGEQPSHWDAGNTPRFGTPNGKRVAQGTHILSVSQQQPVPTLQTLWAPARLTTPLPSLNAKIGAELNTPLPWATVPASRVSCHELSSPSLCQYHSAEAGSTRKAPCLRSDTNKDVQVMQKFGLRNKGTHLLFTDAIPRTRRFVSILRRIKCISN